MDYDSWEVEESKKNRVKIREIYRIFHFRLTIVEVGAFHTLTAEPFTWAEMRVR